MAEEYTETEVMPKGVGERLELLEYWQRTFDDDLESIRKQQKTLLIGCVGAALMGLGAMRLTIMLGKAVAQHGVVLTGMVSGLGGASSNGDSRQSQSPQGNKRVAGSDVPVGVSNEEPREAFTKSGVGYDPGPQEVDPTIKEMLASDGDLPDFHGGENV